MDDWTLPLIGYWDQQIDAININCSRLSRLKRRKRSEACRQITQEVTRAVLALPDDLLLQVSLSMVDNLYKYVNGRVEADEALFEYVEAFGRPFTAVVRQRGYVIQYVAENVFNQEFLMPGPLDFFPSFFSSAGFVYICPQLLALELMRRDGVAEADYSDSLAMYNAEARDVADQVLQTCRDESRHYLFVETDFQEGCLDAALQGRGAAGVISVFRQEAPVPGSKVLAVFPEEKLDGRPTTTDDRTLFSSPGALD